MGGSTGRKTESDGTEGARARRKEHTFGAPTIRNLNLFSGTGDCSRLCTSPSKRFHTKTATRVCYSY